MTKTEPMKLTPTGILQWCNNDGMKHFPLDYLINPKEVEHRIKLYLIKNDPLIKRIINDDDVCNQMQIHAIRCVIEGIINEFVTGE